jgi:hypothetical protein
VLCLCCRQLQVEVDVERQGREHISRHLEEHSKLVNAAQEEHAAALVALRANFDIELQALQRELAAQQQIVKDNIAAALENVRPASG